MPIYYSQIYVSVKKHFLDRKNQYYIYCYFIYVPHWNKSKNDCHQLLFCCVLCGLISGWFKGCCGTTSGCAPSVTDSTAAPPVPIAEDPIAIFVYFPHH